MESSNSSEKGESSNSTNGLPDLVAGVITEEMLHEEKRLEEEAALEAIKMKEELKKKEQEELEEQCYKRLNLLLKHSTMYAKIIADKIERDKVKETKKQQRTGKKANQEDKGKSTVSKGSRKRKLLVEEISDEENKQDIQNIDMLNDDVLDQFKHMPKNQLSLFTGGTMYPYQVEGFEWIKLLFENAVNGILADEMGLGKTIQTIAFVAYLIEVGISGPFFICGPLSTLPNWYAEFKRFTPDIPVFLYHGGKEDRAAMRSKINRKVKYGKFSSCPVILTSYQIALIDSKFLQRYKWATLVIDEGHRIKNFECKLVCALKMFNTSHRLLLTGTPLQNDLKELWSLLNFLLPDIFDDLKVFESWFDISRLSEKGADEEIIAKEEDKQIVSIIHQILSPFLLRRTKVEVNLQLPKKKEIIVNAPMTELQREYYTAVLNRSIEELVNPKAGYFDIQFDLEGGRPKRKKCEDFTKIYNALERQTFEDEVEEISAPADHQVTSKVDCIISDVYINVRNITMILRKVINHPYLISYPLDNVGNHKIDEDLIRNSGKLLVLDQMLPELFKGNHKVLLFSQFVSMLHILEEYCMYRNYQYSYLDGSMKLEDRHDEIKKFNESKDTCIFLISTKAGGLGLNLAAADTVIIFDSDWNPQNDIQAQDRCHRIGQNKPVVVYRLIIPETIDERMINRATAKRKLEKVIMKEGRFNSRNTETNSSTKLSPEELLELLQTSEYRVNGFVKTDDNSVLSAEELQKLLDRSDLEEAM